MLSPSITGYLINKVLMGLVEKLSLSLSLSSWEFCFVLGSLACNHTWLVMTSIFRLSCGMCSHPILDSQFTPRRRQGKSWVCLISHKLAGTHAFLITCLCRRIFAWKLHLVTLNLILTWSPSPFLANLIGLNLYIWRCSCRQFIKESLKKKREWVGYTASVRCIYGICCI